MTTIWDRIVWDRGQEGSVGRINTGVYAGLPVRLIHCDPLVLHAPGACHFCDEHPHLQQARVRAGVGFTDSPEDGSFRYVCPARAQRGDNAQAWGGNRPAGTREEWEAGRARLLESLREAAPRYPEQREGGDPVEEKIEHDEGGRELVQLFVATGFADPTVRILRQGGPISKRCDQGYEHEHLATFEDVGTAGRALARYLHMRVPSNFVGAMLAELDRLGTTQRIEIRL